LFLSHKNFQRRPVYNHFTIGHLGKLLEEFHDFVFNMFDSDNSYSYWKKEALFDKYSIEFFKCIHEHGEEIVEDISTLNKKPI
jgi:hypothetical protein